MRAYIESTWVTHSHSNFEARSKSGHDDFDAQLALRCQTLRFSSLRVSLEFQNLHLELLEQGCEIDLGTMHLLQPAGQLTSVIGHLGKCIETRSHERKP
jgi:hypothetical protein